MRSDGLGHEKGRPHGSFQAFQMCRKVGQLDRHEGSHHFQLAVGELCPERRRVGGHEAPIAQLGALVPRPGDLIEDLRMARHVSAYLLCVKLQYTPGARDVGQP
jgi:hypothetical protein